MNFGRSDYSERIQDTLKKIPKDEPVFLIRGQDEMGCRAVQAWAHLHQQNGGSDVVYLEAMKHAQRMEDWAKKFIGKKADIPAHALPKDHPYYKGSEGPRKKPTKKKSGGGLRRSANR